jgi:hypothetical protein
MVKDTDDALVSRALSAYFRPGHGRQQLVTNCRVRGLAQNRYVVLSDINGVLAVYSIRGGGILRRLRRWPNELDQ